MATAPSLSYLTSNPGGTLTPGQGMQEQGPEGPAVQDWWSQNAPPAGSGGNPTDPAYIQQQLQQFYASQGLTPTGPGSGPTDIAYFAQKIAETGGWTPQNAAYWTQRIPQEVQKAGAGGGGSPADIMAQDPGYQFRLDQGLRALQSGAAAKGTLLTGGTQKALQQYGQEYASGEFGNIFNRNLSLANLGANAAAGQGSAAGAYGANAGNLMTGAGNAAAAGTIGSANAWGGTLGQLGSLAQYYAMLRQMQGGSSYGGVTPQQSNFWGGGNQGPVL